jgi:hypothetical protein
MQGLFATAAKTSFPGLSYSPPNDQSDGVVPSRRDQPAARASRLRWLNWVVAASLLLAVLGAGLPALVSTVGYARHRPKVDAALIQVEAAKADLQRETKAVEARKRDADETLAAVQKKQEALEKEWIAMETAAVKQAAEQPFLLDLQGPATATAGAPNEYRLSITNPNGTPLTSPVSVETKVKDVAGNELYSNTFTTNPATGANKLTVPAGVWAKAKANSEVFLSVSVTDRAGLRSDLVEKLQLTEPVYTTFLTTDKPMYRPGEVVYFRSLTLDRTHFLPPTREKTLRFEIQAPSGQVLAGSAQVGLTRLATSGADGVTRPVLGPDGKPIRGVGNGAFTLPSEIAGGEYTLKVFEVPAPGEAATPAQSKPLAQRKFIVNQYTPDKLRKKLEFDGKSYGPGDVVQAKFELHDQDRPLADATLRVTAQANGAEITLSANPTKTAQDGTANIRFTLPKLPELHTASISVMVTTPAITETLVRPIPLATRTLTVEFFPEGGDLIVGVPNRVYFRATTSTGKPADIAGTLTDGTADICSLKALTDAEHPGVNQGLGMFEFTPVANKTYAVKLEKPFGIVPPDGGYQLPAAKNEGVVLSVPTGVTKAGEPIPVRLTSVGAKRTVLVGMYIRGRAVAHEKATLEPGRMAEVALKPGDTKLGGVTRITVFDLPNDEALMREDLKPLAERLVFRTPGETLKLNYSIRKTGVNPNSSLVPGARVQMDVTSTDETGAAKPAILWTAVVNQNVVTMADEKSERMMPTHFLLAGEVQKGEELEHADFLLTDHKKAAEAIDLLLGTQGWRRFVEQGPEFRKQVPAEEAERLQLVSTTPGPIAHGWRPALRRVFDEYWPKYEVGLAELTAAEQARLEAFGNASLTVKQADNLYQQRLAAFGDTAAQLKGYDEWWELWRSYLPYLLAVFGGLALMAGIIRQMAFRPGAPERRPLGIAVLVLLGLMGALGLMALYTGRDNDGWRSTWAVAPKPVQATHDAAAAPEMAQVDRGGMVANRPMAGAEAPAAFELDRDPKRAMPKEVPAGPAVVQNIRPEVPEPTIARAPLPGFGGMDGVKNKPEDKKDNAWDFALRRNQFGADREEAWPKKRGVNPPAAAKPGEMFDIAMIPPAMGEAAPQQWLNIQEGFRPKLRLRFNEFLAQRQDARTKSVLPQFLPQSQPMLVREYAHTRPELDDAAARTDFTETLFWHPAIVTPTDGKASVTFSLSDDVAPYRVLVAGHTLDGRIGAITGIVEVRKPFSLDPKLPLEVCSADQLMVPVIGINGTGEARTAEVAISTVGFKTLPDGKITLDLAANAGGRKLVPLTPDRRDGELSVQLQGTVGRDQDSVIRTLTVVPDGFPITRTKSDVLEQKTTATFAMPEMIVPGTAKLKVSMYPNTLTEIQSGLEGLLREPNGCFEQTSTTNYPNVLILDYLNETNQAKPEVSKRAKDLLDRGYGKLISFECQTRDGRQGYEWFGGTAPPHEALTAYGLLQFTDMARLHPVDAAMLKRTKDYLLRARNGQGGFTRNSRAIDTFGYAPEHLTNAYIVWSITEAERKTEAKSDLEKEVSALLQQSKDGPNVNDPYFLGLVANCLLNTDKRKDAETLLTKISTLQQKDGSLTGAATSITNSRGEALLIETTSLAVLAWLKSNEVAKYRENVEKACRWIGTKRGGYGGYGSTQSTILALKALIEFARTNKRPAENGSVRVLVNGAELAKKDFRTEQSGPIVLDIPDMDQHVRNGKLDVTVETDAKQAYPCTVAWECRSRKPESAVECPVKISTQLNKLEAAEGDTVRLNVRVENLKEKQNGMVTAIVGIPAGLKLPEDMKQMKLLTESAEGQQPTVSYWEKRGREVVFYWRGMAEKQTVQFDLDLIADIPGTYVGAASRAYLYYGAEHKHWADPLKVTVTAK